MTEASRSRQVGRKQLQIEAGAKLADSRTLRYCGTMDLPTGGLASAEYQAKKSFNAFW